MAELRTTEFTRGVVSDTSTHDIYTVPAGKRIILKRVSLLEGSGTARTVQIRLRGVGAFLIKNIAAYPADGASVEVERWTVFNAGDVLQIKLSASGDVVYVLSGSLLYV